MALVVGSVRLSLLSRSTKLLRVTYDAIADALADDSGRNSARRVGTIMALYGAAVPWHRVVGAGGRLPPGHETEARRRLEAEGASFRGARVVIVSR